MLTASFTAEEAASFPGNAERLLIQHGLQDSALHMDHKFILKNSNTLILQRFELQIQNSKINVVYFSHFQ